MAKVAFIGLGVMGYPMAGHLAQAGHDVAVYNRTHSKAQQWCKDYMGECFATPAQASGGRDAVFMCVGNDDDVRSVVYGADGVLAGLSGDNSAKGAVLVDHTTASAELARELYNACDKQNLGFVDAPVSGGQAGAEGGQLTIMCGGDDAVFTQVRSIMDCYAKYIGLIGDVGSGQLCKMVNQICIVGLVQALSEGLNFAQKANLDTNAVLEAIKGGAAGSWQMENRWQTMAQGEFDFGFAVDWVRKDLGICFDEAKQNGAQLPIAKIVDGYYQQVQDKGGNRFDTSSLILNLRDK